MKTIINACIGLVISGCTFAAIAQTPEPSTVKIGTAPLLTPSALETYYAGSTTATASSVATEVVDLARALRNDPDKIYDFVRNNVRTEWLYGVKKGPLGTLIELSGTPFDQAALMVALLRESGKTASYVVGTLTLDGPKWQEWAGITSAAATCQLLSSGGFGAIINGDDSKATCDWGSTTVTQVTLSHIWVKVNIDGTNYVFDPSYKGHTFEAGRGNLLQDAGLHLAANKPLTAAVNGMLTGVAGAANNISYVRKLDEATLSTKLQTAGESLLTVIEQNHLASDIEEVIGGEDVIRDEGNPRVTSLAGTEAQTEWTGGIPDAYRTTLQITIKKWRPTATDPNPTLQQIATVTVFSDDVAGRRVSFNTVSKKTSFSGTLAAGPSVVTWTAPNPNTEDFLDTPGYSYGEVTLAVNHPYAATASGSPTSGTYLDTTVTKPITFATNATFVLGWGDTSNRMVEKWEGRADKSLIMNRGESYDGNCDNCTSSYYMPSHGDGRREKLAVNWLAQASTAARLHAALAKSIYAHHHSIGIAYGDASVKSSNINNAMTQQPYWVWNIVDSFDRIDVDSAFSLTSQTADGAARRAAVHAIAATSAALEGSVAAQISDTPDVSSTSIRFRWGNKPPAGEPNAGTTPERRFYLFNAANSGAVQQGPDADLLLLENQASNTTNDDQAKGQCIIGSGHLYKLRGNLAAAIDKYAQSNYEVITVGESFLGPGTRCGPWRDFQHASHLNPDPYMFNPRFTTLQRGGALVATRYNADDPTEIAHIVVSANNSSKGGGSGAQSNHQTSYDPAEAADVLKARFVDQSNALGVDLKKGSLTYTSPVSLTVGTGEFPYSLTASMTFKAGYPDAGTFGPITWSEPQTPWTSNWQNSLSMSGSGLQAMGTEDARAAAGTIAAFLALQDVYKQPRSIQREAAAGLVAAWWTDRLVGNTVTVQIGTDTKQFVKNARDEWIMPGAGPVATLTQTGTRTAYYEQPCKAYGEQDVILTRSWNNSNLSFTVTNAHGDVQTFAYWKEDFDTDPESGCARQRGFRLTKWEWPNGMEVTVNYIVPDANSLPQISSVSNNIGRTIVFYDGGRNGFSNGLLEGDSLAMSIVANADGSTTHTDWNLQSYRFEYDQAGWKSLKNVYSPVNPSQPVLSYSYGMTVPRVVKEIKDGVAVQGGRDAYKFFIAEGVRGERMDPAGKNYVVMYDLPPRPTSQHTAVGVGAAPGATASTTRHINELGYKTEIGYDGRGRVVEYLYPELDRERFEYDARNNTTKITKVGKPATEFIVAQPDIVIEAGWHATWNKPTFIKDALGRQTDFTYYSAGNGKGQIWTATRPAAGTVAPDNIRPVYTFTYNNIGQLTQSVDPTGLTTTNTYQTSGYRDLLSTAVDPSGLNLITGYIHNARGDVTQITDPRGNVTRQTYDNVRRKLETLHHNGTETANLIAAERTEYDGEGRVIYEKAGKTFSGTTVSVWETIATKTYTPTGKVKTETDGDNRTTTYDYDAVDRVEFVTDAQGRKTRSIYDDAGQLIVERRGVGSRVEVPYATYTYSANGNRTSVKDAKNNLTEHAFDVFNREFRTCFPGTTGCATTPAAATTPLYEQLSHDAQGNVLSKRNRANENLVYTYDGLDRMKTRLSSGVTTTWTYDRAGRVDVITDTAGYSIDNDYDTAKRLTSTARTVPGLSGTQTVAYQLDGNGNRTRLTWPDAFSVNYNYDKLNRLGTVQGGATYYATYTYDHRSRRTNLSFGGGASSVSTPTYSVAGDLSSMAHSFNGGVGAVTFNYTYTDVHQLKGVTATSSSSYLCASNQCAPLETKTYATNALNQYTDVGGQAVSYDLKGNLTGDGVWIYGYDAENRLMSATKSGSTVTYGYDPLGHRAKKTVNGATTFYLGDAQDEEIAEYDGSGALVMRYVPGPAIDQPIAQITPGGYTSDHVTFFHKDKLGSVIAMSGLVNGQGGTFVEGPYKYDAYGRGAPGTGTPYKYTGRRYDGAAGDTGLYYYRARYYSAALGRFMQTDPIGMKDDINLYSYVQNTPLNATDPTGEVANFVWGAAIGLAIEGAIQFKKGEFDGTDLLVAAGVGAVTAGASGLLAKQALSGTISAGRAVGTTAATGGTASAGGSVVKSALNGEAPDAKNVLLEGAAGTIGAYGGAKVANSMASSIESLYSKGGVAATMADTTIPATSQARALAPTVGEAAAVTTVEAGAEFAAEIGQNVDDIKPAR